MTRRDVAGWLAAAALALAGQQAAMGKGREFFVSPDGRPGGDGSKAAPWDLATALAGAPGDGGRPRVGPADTIRLRGGTYRGQFTSTLRGRQGEPITVRACPGERATIDCRPEGDGPAEFYVKGDWSVFRGLEVTCSDPKRVTAISGSHPSDIRRGGVSCLASHVAFINLVVHDTAGGFGFWSAGEGGEIYGCIIYNNGWTGPDRGHGHAIYAQNRLGTKRLVDNIMFNQFSYGIHVYGSSRAFLKGFHVEGNVSFNNGSANRPGDRTPAIFVGGGAPAERIRLIGNFTYGDRRGGGVMRVGYGWGPRNTDIEVRGNTIVSELNVIAAEKLTCEGNTVVGPDALVRLDFAKGGGVESHTWDNNAYYQQNASSPPFRLRVGKEGRSCALAEWRKLGLDAHSTLTAGRPRGVKVFVRPNRYEPGRAHVIVYNWDGKDAVGVDPGEVLTRGSAYRIVSAQDFYGEPVAEGTYDGRPIRLPMKPTPAARPVGKPDAELPVTEPEFGVFVLLGSPK